MMSSAGGLRVAVGPNAQHRLDDHPPHRLCRVGAARRSMILLSAIFSFAMQRGLRPDIPCAGVWRYKLGKSERYLSAAE
jgi:hypothetical protein